MERRKAAATFCPVLLGFEAAGAHRCSNPTPEIHLRSAVRFARRPSRNSTIIWVPVLGDASLDDTAWNVAPAFVLPGRAFSFLLAPARPTPSSREGVSRTAEASLGEGREGGSALPSQDSSCQVLARHGPGERFVPLADIVAPCADE